MGRKKRRGGHRVHQVHQPPSEKPESRYAQHLTRDGQKQQLMSVLHECQPPPGVSRRFETYVAVFTLHKCYAVPDPRNREDFRSHGRKNHRFPLYHGTGEVAAGHIVLQGFKLPRLAGMFGVSVYLTPDIGKAFGYTDYNRPIIFVCEAVLGEVRVMDEANHLLTQHSASKMGFDTAHGRRSHTQSWGGTLYYNEYAVYDPTRIRITHLLEYKRKKKS